MTSSYLSRPTHTRLDNQRSNINTNNRIDSNIKYNNQKNISSLTGISMNSDDFLHNNMVPFFGGSIKQNTNINANKSILENFTGRSENTKTKKEISSMFNPTQDMSFINGTPLYSNNTLNRYIPSKYRTGETPIAPVKVGPAINAGYNSLPSGGLTQPGIRDFMLPKTVDQLRVKNNPKISYKNPIIKGKSHIDKPTKLGIVEKKTPNSYYENNPNRYNTTVGVVTKAAKRSKCIKKDTGRQHSKQVVGPAGPATYKQASNRAKIRASNKVTYNGDNIRNVMADGKWKDTNISDYGKKGHYLPANERDNTTTRTHNSNLTQLVKALIAPVQDLFKVTKKEITSQIENFGNINGLPNKMTVQDPNDVLKTTIKETNIHNKHIGNMQSQAPPKVTVYDVNDIARTTIKETNIHNKHSGNIQCPYQLTIYDPNDIAKTTIKQTNIHNKRNGNINGLRFKLPAYDPNDIAKTTIKQTNIYNNRDGNLDGLNKQLPVYDPNDIARTTIKQTNIHNNRDGNLDGLNNALPVYDPNDIARTTIKQTNIHNNRDGNLDGLNNALPVYDPNDIARTTIKQTNIHNNRDGNLDGLNNALPVYDPNDIARTTIKQTNIHNNRDGNLDGLQNGLPAYDPNDITKTTIKQTNIHNNRDGNLDSLQNGLPVYDPNDITRTTIKETNIHNNRDGNLNSVQNALPAYDPNDIARTTVKETKYT